MRRFPTAIPLLAMLAPLVAFILQWIFWGFIQPYAWFLFYPAVFISSWIGGRRVGLLATAISVAAVWWSFMPPEYTFVKGNIEFIFPAAVFIGTGILFSFFHERLRKANRHAVEALAGVHAANEMISRLYEEARCSSDARGESEARLNEAQRIAHIGSWELNLVDNALVWSEEIYRIFEIDPIKFGSSYEAFLEKVHPDDRAVVNTAYQNSLKSRAPYSIDHRLLFPDGRIKYVHEQCETFYENGTPLRSIGTVQDITERKQTEEALRQSEGRYRTLFENARDGIVLLDGESGHIVDCNAEFIQMTGRSREELQKMPVWELRPPERVAEARTAFSKAREPAGIRRTDLDLQKPDGTAVPVEFSARPIAIGGRLYIQSICRDMTERKQAEEQQRQAATVFDNTMEAIMIADAERNILAVNKAYTKITGYEPEEVVGKNPRLNQSGKHDQDFYREIWQTLERTGQWQGELWNRRKDGELYPVWENISVVKDDKGRITHHIAVMADISPIKQAEERLTYLAHYDALTELPNRLTFTTNLEHALERAKRHQRKVALLFLDLDHFKLINDTLGHAAGDRLLEVIAKRLKNSVRAEDLAARLGGDEFTVILEEINHPEDAALLAEKIILAVAGPVRVGDHEVVTSTSIGISIYPDDASSAGDLAKAADTAMYRAKNRGRHTYEFYTSELTAQALQRLSTENGLRHALAHDEFILYYQPQIELATGKTLGLEALLRWQCPESGIILPDQFIGVAEDSGLIDAIGECVLNKAFAQARHWREAGLPPMRIAINLSGHQIIYGHLLATVRSALAQNGFKSGDTLFELEITETVLQSGESVVTTLQELQKLGFSIAIDDFGTGYSSLSHLKNLPVDTLKIDRAFLRNIPYDSNNRAITAAIISMGHSLGLKVVAEGVETTAQLDFLRQQGCDEAQGFLFSKPVPAEHMAAFLAQGRHGLHMVHSI